MVFYAIVQFLTSNIHTLTMEKDRNKNETKKKYSVIDLIFDSFIFIFLSLIFFKRTYTYDNNNLHHNHGWINLQHKTKRKNKTQIIFKVTLKIRISRIDNNYTMQIKADFIFYPSIYISFSYNHLFLFSRFPKVIS